MTHIGFTGTRHGMTAKQREAVYDLAFAIKLRDADITAHHGDCVGADADFHHIVRRLDAHVVIHPGPLGEYSAGCVGERRNEMTHFARNRVIVAESDVMIATPYEPDRQPRGGTWYTIGQAEKSGKPLAVVLPSGDVRFAGKEWP